MRWQSAIEFSNNFSDIDNSYKVAIVGGSSIDPEVKFLQSQNVYSIDYFGIDSYGEPRFTFLNLEEFSEGKSIFNNSYDLVICCHVLEHVWNTENALKNLILLAKPNSGKIWVNCPASSIFHSSPNYYYSGLMAKTIANYLEINGATTLKSGNFGNPRWYFMIHILGLFAEKKDLDNPIFTHKFILSSGLFEFLKSVKLFFGRVTSLIIPNLIRKDVRYASETWVLAIKNV